MAKLRCVAELTCVPLNGTAKRLSARTEWRPTTVNEGQDNPVGAPLVVSVADVAVHVGAGKAAAGRTAFILRARGSATREVRGSAPTADSRRGQPEALPRLLSEIAEQAAPAPR